MSAEANYNPDDNRKTHVPCSLPRMITPAVQCSFCNYFWDLYIKEFGWSPAEWGVVSWTCTGTQFVSFILLGVIFNYGIDTITGGGSPGGANYKANSNKAKVNPTKGIEICGTFLHWLTYFFLIILPIKWHDIKTPYVDSILGKTAGFWRILYYGPIRSARKTECIDEAFLWLIRPIWALFFVPMKVFYLIVVNFGAIAWVCFYVLTIPLRLVWNTAGLAVRVPWWLVARTPAFRSRFPNAVATPFSGWITAWNMLTWPYRRYRKPQPIEVVAEMAPILEPATKILPVLETLESIPPPACSACCNTTCCNNFAMRMNHFGRWLCTRTFGIYMLVVANGVGMSMHELSNKALETYAFDGSKGEVGIAIPINLSFFFGSNLLIYILFTFVKLHSRSKAFFAETFFVLSIVFLLLGIPFLIAFGAGLNSSNSTAPTNPGQANITKHWVILAALTTFHSTVVFLIFSGGPLTKYVAVFILDGHKGLMDFGTLVLFGSLLITSFINTGIGAINDFAGTGKDNADKKVINLKEAHSIIVTVCIVGQLSTFFLLYAHEWPWNQSRWLNYLLSIATGVVNSVFVAYANVMLGKLAMQSNVDKLQWIFFGLFYSITNLVVSFFMPIMFRSFGQNEIKHCYCKCFRFSYQYCFPTVYRFLTGLCIAANFIALIAVWHDPDGYWKLSQ